MADPEVTPEQRPNAPLEAAWSQWLLQAGVVAVALVLTIAWIVFLVWTVAQIV